MTITRREFIIAASSLPVASQAVAGQVASVRDFAPTGSERWDNAFRSALRAADTVVVPAGVYSFAGNEAISLRSGVRLIGEGNPVLRKGGSPLTPLFAATNVAGVQLRGMTIRATGRLHREVTIRQTDHKIALPWDLGTPPAIAVALVTRGGERVLQPKYEFVVKNGVLGISRKISLADVEAVRLWREPALCALVDFNQARDSVAESLRLEDGALWVRGTGDAELGTVVRDCTITNGQIRIFGKDNEITPMHSDLRSSAPNGPRGITIERNTLTGKLPADIEKRYLRFSERAAGIEVQGFARQLRIVSNVVSGQAGDGIWLASCADSHVSDNRIDRNGLSGIGLETGTILPSQRCTIVGNTVTNNWFDGCDFNFSTGPADAEIDIRENVFSGNGFDMKPLSGGCGISLYGVRRVTVSKNVCENNNLSGIYCIKSEMVRLDGNTCANNGRSARARLARGAGIAVRESRKLVIHGNRFRIAGRSRQRIDIGFASSLDLKESSVSKDEAVDGPARIGIWNGKDFIAHAM